MFPFSIDPNKYTAITSEEAERTLSENYPKGVLYEVPVDDLPDSLRGIKTLKQAFVSGVQAAVTAAPAEGIPETVIFTIREDLKDAPETGNLNAYLLLRTGDNTILSPPCNKLAPFPHHFSGISPLAAAFKR